MTDELKAQLTRTADRLRVMSVAQLERDERVDAARKLITEMARSARPEATVPELALSSLGDQIFVVGKEFISVASDAQAEAMANQLREFRLSL